MAAWAIGLTRGGVSCEDHRPGNPRLMIVEGVHPGRYVPAPRAEPANHDRGPYLPALRAHVAGRRPPRALPGLPDRGGPGRLRSDTVALARVRDRNGS